MTRPKGDLSNSDGPYGPPGDSLVAASQRKEASTRRQQQDHSSPVGISTSTFYLDNDTREIEYAVDPFELPPLETAQRLFASYMDTVQDSFPILSRTSFKSQFHQYYLCIGQGAPVLVPQKWLAILNILFAIGSQYSHLEDAEWKADDRDHIIYLSRAHILGQSGPALGSHPDLMQVQTTALLALYFLSVGRVNK
jgi:hypothetical protein